MQIPSSIFRNYDVRGEYGRDLSADAGYMVAKAYVKFSGAKRVVIGSDARISSPELKAAVIRGLVESGVEVVDVGVVATDVVYFATWHGRYEGGIMVTASHMPKQFNGLKFLRLNSEGMLEPIGKGLGMEELEAIANSGEEFVVVEGGSHKQIDIWKDYVDFVRNFVDVNKFKKLKVVMDAGNGMGGVVAEKLFAGLNLDIVPLYFEPDGNYPNHEPNPFIEENRQDVIAKVKEVGADLGVAWDADCDRAYFIDENGQFINGDLITALLSIYFLKQKPGAGIVYDLRSSWAVRDWVEKMGGVGHLEKVGHSYIKARMRNTDSVFGGEVSGHYYFAGNAYMDNGFVPVIIMLSLLSEEGKTMSQMIADLGEYCISGEINFKVEDVKAVLENIKAKFSDAKISELDGLSVDYEDWHFNVRPSANDPVLRLNLEAKSEELLQEKLEIVREVIGGEIV